MSKREPKSPLTAKERTIKSCERKIENARKRIADAEKVFETARVKDQRIIDEQSEILNALRESERPKPTCRK